MVGVVGEAGVGKSRLCDEFARSLTERGITVRRTAGVSHGREVPLLPVLAFQRDYFGITDADDPVAARRKVADRLLALDPGLEGTLPLMCDFLEVPDPDRPVPPMAPEVRMRRIFEAIRRITARRSERETLVLIFEDLHWFDPQSEQFLERLVESYPGSRTLVVANFRPEFSARWMRHSYYRQLPLSPLREQAVSELLGRLVGDDASLPSLVSFVLERTAGNPFFVEEMIRALVQDGALAGRPGHYRLTRPLGEFRVPPSVQAVLAARIDHLSHRDKSVLETAAVIGRKFSAALLSRVSGTASQSVEESLTVLCGAELVQSAGNEEYRFWHPLTQEVAYGTLLAARRRELHAAVARTIIELAPDRRDEQAALIATHWEQAGEDFHAAQWNALAARWALRTDVNEAVRRLRATICHLQAVEPSEEAVKLAVKARALLIRWGSRTGMDLKEAKRLCVEGHERAQSLGDQALLGEIIWAYGTANFWHGAVRRGLDYYLEAAHLADQTGEARLQVALWAPTCALTVWTGPIRLGLEAVNKVLTLSQGDPDFGAEIYGYSIVVRTYLSWAELIALSGSIDRARAIAEQGLAMARERAEPEVLAWILSIYHRLARSEAEMEQGLRYAAEALRICEESGNAAAHVTARVAVGIAQVGLSRFDEARSTLEQALAEGRGRQVALFEEPTALTYLARAHARLGARETAQRFADEAVDVARHQGSKVVECLAVLIRAEILRTTGAVAADVAEDLKRAESLIEETGAVSYKPLLHEERGRLHNDETELREALRRYQQIGAAGHAQRLEAELAAAGLGG